MENFDISKIKAIIGLGNPGQKYYKTRHSIGFRIIDELAEKFDGTWQSSDVLEHCIVNLDSDNSQKIYLVKPQTFMNTSGKSISFLTKKGIRPEELLVIHDELEKPFGNISIRLGGSARGHNGLRSIISVIGQNFWRLRFGIDRPEDKSDVSDYVLNNFSAQEEEKLNDFIFQAIAKILSR